MKQQQVREFVIIGFFILLTAVVAGSLYRTHQGVAVPIEPSPDPEIFSQGNGPVTLSAQLVQDKIYAGGDGTVPLALTLSAADVMSADSGEEQHVDIVVVLDQSGSMQGQKINYARQAILNLLAGLSEQDRFSMIGYSDGVMKYADLQYVTAANRNALEALVYNIYPGGNTNLGAGLQQGIDTLLTSHKTGNVEKVILISDGLANRGIVESYALGNLASIAVEKEFGISAVGVGQDFNEQLMTLIADKGAGNYYYLADPQTFANVFQQEFQNTKTVAARGVEIRIPLPDGASLVSASGFPITISNNQAIVHPGDLLSGQTRTLFLTFKLPTFAEAAYTLSGLNVTYLFNGDSYAAALSKAFHVACVSDPNEAVGSIDQTVWEEKVIQEDSNNLREMVSINLKEGRKDEALRQIDEYYNQQQILNNRLDSDKVSLHLNEEVKELRDLVEETFTGSEQEVRQQQKANSKSLQYRGYQERRAKK